MLLFCYGSNLLMERLRERAPEAEAAGVAVLRDHRMTFSKRGRDGSGKCTIAPVSAGADQVHGAVVRVTIADRAALDEAEHGYALQPLRIETAAGPLDVTTYVAERDFIDHALKPFGWYKDLVLSGAAQHALPVEYIEGIRAVEARDDSDLDRATRHRSLIPTAWRPMP
ncbi:MAG: gamma-glutamylcyclotransferase [Planctomycetes bacterium]|nr:gamma-glutamylcyclotransferase [Planctomycetota bacterium]